MATSHVRDIVPYLRRAALRGDGVGLTDGQLLESYVRRRDVAALEALVLRHGPMVWGVCRRVLRGHHDAEDAFQATFLVLVRKAASVVPRELVANWLYGVARQTALKARATAAKRRARERQVADLPEPAALGQDPEPAVQALLDQELSRLPDKYRVAVVLCDLEGTTRREAARQLAWPEGTVASRLRRARALLARRLARRGLALSGGSLAAVLSAGGTSAAVPAPVLTSAATAAAWVAANRTASGLVSAKVAALMGGVLRAMLLSRLRTMLVLLLVIASLGLGGGVLAWQTRAAEEDPPPEQSRQKESAKRTADDRKKTLLDLDERWWKADTEALRKLAADDLITVSGVGRYDKAALLEASQHRRGVERVQRDVEVSFVSKNVAVVTYVYDCKVVRTDGTLFQDCRDRRLSMTWAQRKEGWVVVFAQETILPGGE